MRYAAAMTEFEAELTRMRDGMATAREALLAVLSVLPDDDLARGRRGGWTVAEVLKHVIVSEIAYARVVAHLRGVSIDIAGADDVATAAAAIDALAASRRALLTAVDGVDEATFYDLRAVGHDQYSVLSVLENAEAHDHEHAGQIAKLLAAPSS